MSRAMVVRVRTFHALLRSIQHPTNSPTHISLLHQGRNIHLCIYIQRNEHYSQRPHRFITMLFHKKVIVILVAQSSAFLARAFVTPSPFGLSTPKSCSIAAGPLLVSAVEDEAAEAVVEETEAVLEIPKIPESDAAEELSGDAVASDETAAAQKERLSVFVGNLPFRK